MEVQPTITSPHVISGVGTQQRPTRPPSNTSLCYYHAKFGKAARKCHQKGCSLGHLVVASTSDTEPDKPNKISAVGHKEKKQ